ncbi:MAG: TPM domain-containing protein [Clostridiales bacterium]|nr:TPM domain-containing protein [Clostridiales bacterium]
MKKRLFALFFAVCFCFLTLVPVFAADNDPDVISTEELFGILENGGVLVTQGADVTTAQNRSYRRVIDDGDLLSAAEEEELESKLDEISNRQQFDVVVLTANTLNGKTPMEYADDYYDYNGYGYGDNRDGALLLVSMEDRDWWISTCGYGLTALTDYGIQQIGSWLVSYLKYEEYYNGFAKYADMCDSFVTLAKSGQPVDVSGYSGTSTSTTGRKAPFEFGKSILTSLVVGLLAALIVTGVMRSKLKSVRFQAAANNYVNPGSLNITRRQDMFLYSTVTRTAIPKNTGSSGGGGGSSSHTSSSGTSHGGGGGKF